jgi:hypothetical protein
MPLNLVDFDKQTRTAVKDFWKARSGAKASQEKRGAKDTGERASVTAGKNMNAFLNYSPISSRPMVFLTPTFI